MIVVGVCQMAHVKVLPQSVPNGDIVNIKKMEFYIGMQAMIQRTCSGMSKY